MVTREQQSTNLPCNQNCSSSRVALELERTPVPCHAPAMHDMFLCSWEHKAAEVHAVLGKSTVLPSLQLLTGNLRTVLPRLFTAGIPELAQMPLHPMAGRCREGPGLDACLNLLTGALT